MTIKKLLEGLLKEKAPGPAPSFSVFHIIKVLELTAKEGPIGRGKLSKKLRTGEGVTRTLLNRLIDAGLIVTSKPGCSLTKKGETIWNEFQLIFPQKVKLEKSELTLANYNIAVLIKDCGDKVKTGIEQRDAAILTGAKGATTLIFKNQTLIQPGISKNVARDFPEIFNKITEQLELEENDVIVIGSADTWKKAEYGALAASWTLI
jgi:predicted transcriptional regulator